MTKVEICVDDVGGTATALRGGADRVELCASLSEGGTTPTLGFVAQAARAAAAMDVQVLVRPRSGDFVYARAELDVMLADIAATRAAMEDDARLGFTLGALNPAGDLDEPALAELVAACGPCPVTFHKAFDTVLATGVDVGPLVHRLADLGVCAVLTSGGDGPAVAHLDTLAELVRAAGPLVRVVVAGGVRPANVAEVLSATGCHEIHLRAPAVVGSGSATVSTQYDVGSRTVTSEQVVADVVAAARRFEDGR